MLVTSQSAAMGTVVMAQMWHCDCTAGSEESKVTVNLAIPASKIQCPDLGSSLDQPVQISPPPRPDI